MMLSRGLCCFQRRLDGAFHGDELAGFCVALDPNPLDGGRGLDVPSQRNRPLGGVFKVGIGFEQRFFHAATILYKP